MYYLDKFNPADFLAHYWQKKAVVLKNALPDFQDFLDEHELAGLAMEPDIDSRVIRFHNDNWELQQGPIEDFESACQGQWTLLVQGIDRYLPEASDLMQCFNFIPQWRMDDLMVSFAVEGAGVGPHLDQYDVFLIQGKGRRHWRVGEPSNYDTVCPHPSLQQITGFDAVIDVELAPGDILYIPPGWPHDGIALTDCLTYSVGFRAPDQEALTQALTDTVYAADFTAERYTDPELTTRDNTAEVTAKELDKLRAMMQAVMHSNEWEHQMLCQLSDQGLQPELDEQLWQPDMVEASLEQGDVFMLPFGCRPLLFQHQHNTVLYVNGEAFVVHTDITEDINDIAQGTAIDGEFVQSADNKFELLQLLSILKNRGYLLLADEDDADF